MDLFAIDLSFCSQSSFVLQHFASFLTSCGDGGGCCGVGVNVFSAVVFCKIVFFVFDSGELDLDFFFFVFSCSTLFCPWHSSEHLFTRGCSTCFTLYGQCSQHIGVLFFVLQQQKHGHHNRKYRNKGLVSELHRSLCRFFAHCRHLQCFFEYFSTVVVFVCKQIRGRNFNTNLDVLMS